MTVSEDQAGLSKPKLKAGDKVTVVRVNDKMVLVEKDGNRFWINEKYLKE